MAHASVEDRIRQLERRLREVEGAPRHSSNWRVSLKTSEDRARVFGWGLTTLALLGLFLAGSQYVPFAGAFFGTALVIGLILIAAASGFLGHSDSYLQLLSEDKASRRLHARDLHRHPAAQTFSRISPQNSLLALGILLLAGLLSWNAVTSTANPWYQLVPPALLLVFIAVWAGRAQKRDAALSAIVLLTALFFVAANPFVALITAIASFALIWVLGWERFDLAIITWSGAGLSLAAFGQAYWGLARLTEPEMAALVAAAFSGLILTALPYAARRRTLSDRDISRFLIALTPVLALSVMTGAGPYEPFQNLLAGLLLTIVGYSALAYAGWLAHGRLSYAKYFLTVALAGLLFFMYLLLDSVSIALLWFILGVVVTAAGFALPSYTARLVGMFVLAIAVLHYLFTVLSAPQIAGPVLLHDRVWLGLVIAMFLPAIALWYQQAHVNDRERRLAPLAALGLSATAFVILLSLGYLELAGPYQSGGWMLLGAGTIAFSQYTRLKSLRYCGAALFLVATLKLVAFDIFTLATTSRMLLLLVVALFLIALGTTLPQRIRYW